MVEKRKHQGAFKKPFPRFLFFYRGFKNLLLAALYFNPDNFGKIKQHMKHFSWEMAKQLFQQNSNIPNHQYSFDLAFQHQFCKFRDSLPKFREKKQLSKPWIWEFCEFRTASLQGLSVPPNHLHVRRVVCFKILSQIVL